MTEEEARALIAGIKPPEPQHLKEVLMIRKDNKIEKICADKIEKENKEKK